MKNPAILFTALLFVFSFAFSNCSGDNDILPTTEETLTRNGWEVEYYFQQQDMTGEFSEYRITFRASGVINCQNGNEVISGNWIRDLDQAQNEIINISINTTNPGITKLNGSWALVNHTSRTMNFEDGLQPTARILHIRAKP